MDTGDRLRQEIEATHLAFHHLLDSISDEAFALPSDNPSWTIGQVLYHMSFAPRFMILDTRRMAVQRIVYRLAPLLIPKRLFDNLNARLTRYGARNCTRQFLGQEYDQAHLAALSLLDSLSEADFARSLPFPDWDPLLTGEVSVEDQFGYIKRHFDSHAAQIEKVISKTD